MTRTSSVRSFRLTLVYPGMAVLVGACGGGAESAPKAPSADHAPPVSAEPRTVEEAEEQIARARASLLEEGGADTKAASDATVAAEKAPEGGAPAREPAREDRCGGPCRALASMKRAVEALCRMTGDGDHRCVDARRTLGESTGRVAGCRCED